MRIAFFGLLLVNILLFAGSLWLSPPVTPAASEDTLSRLQANNGASSRILLASERQTDPTRDSPESGAAAGAETVDGAGSLSSTTDEPREGGAAALPLRCESLGPFPVLATAEQTAATLSTAGYAPRQRRARGALPDGYMVVIGRLKGEADQARVIRRLTRGGLDDAFALPRLDDGYAVSVGLFSVQPRAERRALAVQRMGLEAAVVERTRPGTVYWLDVEQKLPAGEGGAPAFLQEFADPALKLRIETCPEPGPVG